MLSKSNQTTISLGGHGKFVFRQGWLKKGYDVVNADPLAFYKEDSYIKLGVGKVMADSIRYWCQAFEVVEEIKQKSALTNQSEREYRPTDFGRMIFDQDALDPFLEHYSTLWLLHWRITNNRQRGLINHIAFSKLFDVEFKKHQLLDLLSKELPREGVTPTDAMVEKEAEVFLRTYVPSRGGSKASLEESLDCPLADLNLITYIEADDVYRFRIGPKNTLTVDLFQYCFVEYLDDLAKTRKTVAVDEFIYGVGSPGQFFKLDENSVVDFIEQIETASNGAIQIQETAGLRQVYIHDLPALKTGAGLGHAQ